MLRCGVILVIASFVHTFLVTCDAIKALNRLFYHALRNLMGTGSFRMHSIEKLIVQVCVVDLSPNLS